MADDEQAGPTGGALVERGGDANPLSTERGQTSIADGRRKVAGLATREVPGVGAGLGAGVSAYRRGKLDLVELQDRLAPQDPRRRASHRAARAAHPPACGDAHCRSCLPRRR